MNKLESFKELCNYTNIKNEDTRKNGEELTSKYIENIHTHLDELVDEDFFGTEGQNDPRGDHREYDHEDLLTSNIYMISFNIVALANKNMLSDEDLEVLYYIFEPVFSDLRG